MQKKKNKKKKQKFSSKKKKTSNEVWVKNTIKILSLLVETKVIEDKSKRSEERKEKERRKEKEQRPSLTFRTLLAVVLGTEIFENNQ